MGNNPKELFDKLVYKVLSVGAYKEVGDSNVRRILHREYNTEKDPDIDTFINKRGKMSTGLHTVIDTPYDSYNILTNISLNIGRSFDEIGKSSDRFSKNKDAVIIYVNGIKIPDSRIYLYMTSTNTNILVPKQYFNKGINEVIIEEREFIKYTYGGTCKTITGNNLSFPVKLPDGGYTVNKDNTLVYIDGLLTPVASSSYTSGMCSISLLSSVTNATIEVFIDYSAKYRNSYTISGTKTIPFYISESYKDTLYEPINRDNCGFYIDGYRISNKDVIQVGRNNFTYTGSTFFNNAKVTVIVSDDGFVGKESCKVYGSDYYLYNMLGVQGVTTTLMTGKSGTILDGKVNFTNILDMSYNQYTDYNTIVNSFRFVEDYMMKCYKLIEKYPYLLKDFLEYYAITPVRRLVEYNHIKDGDYKTIPSTLHSCKDGQKIVRIVYCNGLIAYVDTVITDGVNWWNFKIDKRFLNNGTNEVYVIETVTEVADPNYRVCEVNRVETSTGVKYRVDIPVFGTIKTLDDLRIMTICKKVYDKDGIYFKNSEYGFKTVNYPTIILDGVIYIDFGVNDPRLDVVIVTSTRHCEVMEFTVGDIYSDYDSLFNELYIGIYKYFVNNKIHEVKIPILHEGKIYVRNRETGEQLFSNVDYMYKSPSINDLMRNSGIMLDRITPIGTVIDVVFVPSYIKNDIYKNLSVEDTGDNKYGLLYLSNLKFPYSDKYVDIHANGKILDYGDIDQLSDKLVRLHNSEVSLQNVFVEYSFNVNFNILEPFIKLYKVTDFEKAIGDIFSVYDYTTVHSPIYSISQTNAVYESFVNGVDSNNKTPNPIRVKDYISKKFDLYIDALMKWLTSDRSDHIVSPIRELDTGIISELEIYRNNSSMNGDDFIIDPTKEQTITNFDLDLSEYYNMDRSQRMKIYADSIISMQSDGGYNTLNYEETIYQNRLRYDDMIPLDCVTEFTGEDIIIGLKE